MVIVQRAEARADERAGFEASFRQVSRSAFLLARQLGRDPEGAADAVQEAALRAWRYRASRTSEFRPWFLTIVYRVARGRIRDWLPLPAAWDRAGPDPFETSMDPELLGALRSLPARQRTALWLRYCEDMTTGDVARIIGCSDTAAKQLLSRARGGLRARLAKFPEEKI